MGDQCLLTEGAWTRAKERGGGEHYSVLLLIHQPTDRPPCLGEQEGEEEGGGWKSDLALCYC